MKTKINLLLILIGLSAGWTALPAEGGSGQLIDKIVASVDELPIFYTDIEAEYQVFQAKAPKKNAPTRSQLLENALINKILLANAAKQGVHIKSEEVERNLQARMVTILQQVGTEARLEQYTGKSIEVFKEELRKSIREQLTMDRVRYSIVENVSLSPHEVKQFFEQLPIANIPVCPTMVEVYQLVRYPHVSTAGKQRLESLRIEILEKRKQFTEAAREVSEDESTAAGGGELGYWKIGQLDAGYEQAALSLQPGEISEIVETQFGLHLIQLIEKKKDQYNTRHILIKRSANKQRVEELLEEMKKLRHRIIEEKVSFEKAVKKYAMADEVTKQRGGLLTGQEGGLQMPIDQLPAELGCLVDKMLPNTISEPALFTTDTGEQGARIVYLKEKIPSHRASLEKDYERIYQEASAAKKQKALESWLEAAKRTTIIQLDLTYEPAKELQQKYGKK